jgi:outer membrane lipoprotein-sorting protein
MKKLAINIILAGLFLSYPALAETQVRLNAEQVALLTDAQDYLAKVKTLKASFVQINPSSNIVSSGKFALSKPGRLKMSYSEPYRIDYYVNDDDLIQYDHDLDEVTRGSAPENPLKLLLYSDVSLSRNDIMNVTNVTDDGLTFSVYMLNKADKIREISGFILKFNKTPIEMLSIGRIDYAGNNTSTNLSATSVNGDIDDDEFVFKKPKRAYPR